MSLHATQATKRFSPHQIANNVESQQLKREGGQQYFIKDTFGFSNTIFPFS
jgi:hypothetical protein